MTRFPTVQQLELILINLFRPQSGRGASVDSKSDSISIHTIKTTSGDSEELITEDDPPKGCWHSFTKGVGGMIHCFEKSCRE